MPKNDAATKGASKQKRLNLISSRESAPRKNEVPRDKYFLKSLHQEIDFYDRKLAYLNEYQIFASRADREDAERKMLAKRAALAEIARELAAAGVEFNPSDLPRSFRAPENTAKEL